MAQRRILLVEDDGFLRKAAAAALRRKGYEALVAGDGEEAIAIAHAAAPELILLDVIMPKLQGFEVLARLKESAQTRHIPVMMLSNLGQQADVDEALRLGAATYMVKAHTTLEALVKKVEELLGVGA